MIQTPPSQCKPVLELVSIRALECLMPDQMVAAAAALTEAQGWDVDQHVDYTGHVMIVATHEGTGQTFALSGAATCVELARVHNDTLVACGTFQRIEAALDVVRRAASRHTPGAPVSR